MVLWPFKPNILSKTTYTDFSNNLTIGPLSNPALVLIQATSDGRTYDGEDFVSFALNINNLDGDFSFFPTGPSVPATSASASEGDTPNRSTSYVYSIFLPPNSTLTISNSVPPTKVVVIELGQ